MGSNLAVLIFLSKVKSNGISLVILKKGISLLKITGDFSFKISSVFIRLDWFQMPYFHSWQIFAKGILTHLPGVQPHWRFQMKKYRSYIVDCATLEYSQSALEVKKKKNYFL